MRYKDDATLVHNGEAIDGTVTDITYNGDKPESVTVNLKD